MKVEGRVRTHLTKATIRLESEREINCLMHLLLCDINPAQDSLRQLRLDEYGLSQATVYAFQCKLKDLLQEDG